jgi:hypothetical protein
MCASDSRKIMGFKSRIFSGFVIEDILMKTSRLSEPKILATLRQAEGGVPVLDLCREHRMSTASFSQIAIQIPRHGRVDDQPDEGSGG